MSLAVECGKGCVQARAGLGPTCPLGECLRVPAAREPEGGHCPMGECDALDAGRGFCSDGAKCERSVAGVLTAPGILHAAAGHINQRASTYDQPQGERSMAATVAAFNAVTGRDLQESEGWTFMQILKIVRDRTAAGGHADSQEDNVAYGALAAEARRAGR